VYRQSEAALAVPVKTVPSAAGERPTVARAEILRTGVFMMSLLRNMVEDVPPSLRQVVDAAAA
jgi:hypothetical protein